MTKVRLKADSVIFQVWDKFSKNWLYVPVKAKCWAHDGRVYKLFRIGALGKCLGRTPDAIQHWEREGKFPSPTFKIEEDPNRYYSEDQIRMTAFMYRTILGDNPESLRGKGLNMPGFFKAVNENWGALDFDPVDFEVREVATGKNDVNV